MKTALLCLTLVVTLCSGDNADRAPRYLLDQQATWGPWSGYSGCTPSCPGGTKTRTRHCYYNNQEITTSKCSGAVSMQFQTCTQSDCTSTSSCLDALSTCSTYGRTACNAPYVTWATQNCAKYCEFCKDATPSPPPFSTHGTWGYWSSWTHCSASCGTGTAHRTRHCTTSQPCLGYNTDTRYCNMPTCRATTTAPAPVNGNWGAWGSYSHCSHSCGSGTMVRYRACNHPAPAHGGYNCYGTSSMTSTCNNGNCATTTTTPAPVNGNWGPWTAYSHCTHSCGSGMTTRRRECNNPAPAHGGQYCHGTQSQFTTCHLQDCATTTTTPPPVNGNWGPWGSYSQCSHSCGSGLTMRQRSCNNPAPAHGGHGCLGSSSQTTACHLTDCVVNGGWGDWATWTSCSATCNLGTISRTRACNHPAPAHGGATCAGNTTETHECSNGPCPVWSHWFEGTCSVSCGTGTRERLRHCSSGKDGDCAGVAYQQVNCTTVTCV